MKKILVFIMMIFSFNVLAINLQNSKKEIVKYEDVIKSVKHGGIITYNALWCPHCQKDLKLLNEFSKKKPNVKIITIFTDSNMERAGYKNKLNDVLKYMKDNNYQNFEVYYDYNNEFAKFYGVSSIPIQSFIEEGKLKKPFESVLPLEDLMYIFRKY